MFPYKEILLSFILFSQHHTAECAETQLPHPGCVSYTRRNFTSLRCTNASLEFPTNFNVAEIPRDISALDLDCPQPDVNKTDVYCNVMQRNAQPFPALPQLRQVGLYRFTTDTGERLPVSMLLANVKHQIERLFLKQCRIGKLDAAYLKGFSALLVLNLNQNDISEIEPNTFHETPVLANLRLVENRVSSLDWTVLEPVKNSLFRFHLNNQKPGLQTITRSGSKFAFKSITDLNLSDNNLTVIPKDILDTINLLSNPYADATRHNNGNNTTTARKRPELRLSFGGNPFCPSNPDCLCCEMKHFFTWLSDAKQNAEDDFRSHFYYDCGSLNRKTSYAIFAEGSRFQIGTGERDSRGGHGYGYFVERDPPNATHC